MKLVSMTCPNCSAGLQMGHRTSKMDCPYCGTFVTAIPQGGDEALKALRPIANSLSNIQFGTARIESKLDRVIQQLDQFQPDGQTSALPKMPVRPLPISVTYPTSPGESFAARHVGFLVICCFIMVAVLLVSWGIGTALFWMPFIFFGLYVFTGTEANGRQDKVVLFLGWIVLTICITIFVNLI